MHIWIVQQQNMFCLEREEETSLSIYIYSVRALPLLCHDIRCLPNSVHTFGNSASVCEEPLKSVHTAVLGEPGPLGSPGCTVMAAMGFKGLLQEVHQRFTVQCEGSIAK